MNTTSPHKLYAPPLPAAPEAGFTIVEAMITLATVFISALILAGANVVVHGHGRLNQDRSRALEQVEALMEQMAATPINNLPVLFPDGQAIPAFNDRGLAGLRIAVTYENPAARPLRYAVEANWTGQQGRTSRLLIQGVRNR